MQGSFPPRRNFAVVDADGKRIKATTQRPTALDHHETKPCWFSVGRDAACVRALLLRLFGVINSILLVPVAISFANIIFRDVFFEAHLPMLIKLVRAAPLCCRPWLAHWTGPTTKRAPAPHAPRPSQSDPRVRTLTAAGTFQRHGAPDCLHRDLEPAFRRGAGAQPAPAAGGFSSFAFASPPSLSLPLSSPFLRLPYLISCQQHNLALGCPPPYHPTDHPLLLADDSLLTRTHPSLPLFTPHRCRTPASSFSAPWPRPSWAAARKPGRQTRPSSPRS